MSSDEIRVIKQDMEPTVNEQGRIVDQMRIMFKVGDDGPFILRFPFKDFDGNAARLAMEEFARGVRTMRGGR